MEVVDRFQQRPKAARRLSKLLCLEAKILASRLLQMRPAAEHEAVRAVCSPGQPLFLFSAQR